MPKLKGKQEKRERNQQLKSLSQKEKLEVINIIEHFICLVSSVYCSAQHIFVLHYF